MVLLAAAAIAASSPQGAPISSVGPHIQARATVRIISGVRIHFGVDGSADAPAARDTVVHTEDAPRPAKLIEFE
jgi:hypothetical protein